jgi:hypothetical protein
MLAAAALFIGSGLAHLFERFAFHAITDDIPLRLLSAHAGVFSAGDLEMDLGVALAAMSAIATWVHFRWRGRPAEEH